jgi:hypothetical protein
MKKLISPCLLYLLTGCVYDPPKKGYDIIIHNQTGQYVYVVDSLPATGRPVVYDTFLVNKRPMVQAMGNYIPEYAQWRFFLLENQYQYIRSKKAGKDTLYFIKAGDIDKSYDSIKNNRLYTMYPYLVDEIKNNTINRLFYYNDSIVLMHTFNVETK